MDTKGAQFPVIPPYACRKPETVFSIISKGGSSGGSSSGIGGGILKFASNVEYELYADGKFVGMGGHRCTLHEAYIDEWAEYKDAKELRIRLHWINPKTSAVLYRSTFEDPFFVSNNTHPWQCFHETSLTLGAKICSQLAHQNIIRGEEMTPGQLLPVNASKWQLIPLPVERMNIVCVDAQRINEGIILSRNNKRVEVVEGEDVTNVINSSTPLFWETYDMRSIGLSKVIVEDNKNDTLLIVYSEVAEFDDIWKTSNRRKVRMADAVLHKTGAPFGYRGCRYIHFITSQHITPTFTAYRAVYPLAWKMADSAIDADPLLSACRANLNACVDGGVVDTCWRERVQWVGDLRMAAKALRTMTNDTKVVSFALHQIADSYDPKIGMVQGAWPCRNPGYTLHMPMYHLAYCMTALEHDPTLGFSKKVKQVVTQSLKFWKDKYLQNGLIKGTPGWMFVDWDFTDDQITAQDVAPGGINAVCNVWWHQVCSLLNVPSGIDLLLFENTFKKKSGYSLYPGGHPNIHTTACVVAAQLCKDDACYEFLLSEKWKGNTHKKVTAYFAYFIAEAMSTRNPKSCLTFINDFYLPIAQQHGSIYEKCDASASMAHSWSVGFVELYMSTIKEIR